MSADLCSEEVLNRVTAVISADDAVRSPDVFFDLDTQTGRDGVKAFAARVIEAYLTEPPKWPTAETLDAAFGTYFERDREHIKHARDRVRGALLAHDPIIKAAVALRDRWQEPGDVGYMTNLDELVSAVDEAGL